MDTGAEEEETTVVVDVKEFEIFFYIKLIRV